MNPSFDKMNAPPNPGLSVIICAHNPRSDYLRRVLAAHCADVAGGAVGTAADRQLLAGTLVGKWDLVWHPRARHIREDELGLTPARLRGIRESRGELLVFVDDDNVLEADYLQACLEISAEWPRLGPGEGSNSPNSRAGRPPSNGKPTSGSSTLSRDLWTNNYDTQITPAGAGICVRRSVADRYAVLARNDPLRLALGRRGSNLVGAEDVDMAYVACDHGLGMGRFVHLKLITSSRPNGFRTNI